MVLFVFQFPPVSNFGKFINLGLGTVWSERVNRSVEGTLEVTVPITVTSVLFSHGGVGGGGLQ